MFNEKMNKEKLSRQLFRVMCKWVAFKREGFIHWIWHQI